MGEAAAVLRPASRLAAERPVRGAVEVWQTPISSYESELATLERMLAPGERSFAARLRSPGARARFVVTRATLRRLLGEYVGCEPAAVELRTGPHGKPELREAVPGMVHFNVSHSGDLALLAFASDSPVGVDVERERGRSDLAGISSRFFAPEEHAAIMAAPPGERLRAFLALWTAKEALLKARGDGLRGLDDVRVALGPAGAAAIAPRSRGRDLERWSVRTLAAAPGYVAALAARSLLPRVQVRVLPFQGSSMRREPSYAH